MIRIPYPTDLVKLADFNALYVSALSGSLASLTGLAAVLERETNVHGNKLTWEYLVTASFDELFDLNEKLKKLSAADPLVGPDLALLNQYSSRQSEIANFFMKQTDVTLTTCYYCNIDSIFSFSELGDFKSGLDFLNRATIGELQFFPGITARRSRALDAKRKIKRFTNIAETGLPAKIQADLTNFDPENTHNHFTLDHFYDKATYPYLSLCLYNFVPSCYACNSKFKGSGKLYDTNALYSSPTSKDYSFYKDVTFKLMYHHRRVNFKTVKDFNVTLDISKNQLSHEAYITQLKIRGRYAFYKKEVLRLIRLKEKYPESKIREMALAVKMPTDEIRKQVYGRELFESAYDYAPLVKYKRDIARNIKLIS